MVAERIDIYRKHCTVLELIPTRATLAELMTELENYAGSELDPEYP